MTDDSYLLVVAAYQDSRLAGQEFEDVLGLVRNKQVRAEGVVLVDKDDDGRLTVADTGDRLGRKGAGWGGRTPSGRRDRSGRGRAGCI